jgi:hypothetical protein
LPTTTQRRGFRHRRTGGQGQRQRRDDGVAGAGDVGYLARDGRNGGVAVGVREPHALLAACDEDGVALRARAEVARRVPRVLVGADAEVRGHLRLVMVRRDERRAGVAAEMRNLRVDDERDALG